MSDVVSANPPKNDAWRPYGDVRFVLIRNAGRLKPSRGLVLDWKREGRGWEALVVWHDDAALKRILAGIVGVELFWVIGMTVFESMLPIRMAELLGSETRAGALLGPVAAGGWAVFALGSVLAARLMRRWGVVRAAIAARILNGLGAALMGLMFGPAALVTAYLVTYMLHGVGGAPHATLLHREASARNRATILSMNSMVMFAGGAVAGPVIGWLAAATSVQAAMVVAGLVSVLGAVLYLPALRAEKDRQGSTPRDPEPTPA